MKQVVVISGKGGTGKTVLTASLSALAENSVFADCDVDASNLHFFLKPEIQKTQAFFGNKKARIIPDACSACGLCVDICRFDALHATKSGIPRLDQLSCEGCAVCSHICPEQAIAMDALPLGEWYLSHTPYGYFVHAKLGIAEENSGKLVSLVRKHAQEVALKHGLDTVIIDGPPGIGCPVIASLAGTDLALVVAEPTPSGVQDMERILKTAAHFKIKTACCINKYDLNLDLSRTIETWCAQNSIPVLGKIPFDTQVIEAVIKGIPPSLYLRSNTATALQDIWRQIQTLLAKEDNT
jgi:MinD superfamily P-loop ATPase